LGQVPSLQIQAFFINDDQRYKVNGEVSVFNIKQNHALEGFMNKVKNGDRVKIHYTGKLKDGE